MADYHTSKHRVSKSGTTDSITNEVDSDLAELLNRVPHLTTLRNVVRPNEDPGTNIEADLLEQFVKMLHDK